MADEEKKVVKALKTTKVVSEATKEKAKPKKKLTAFQLNKINAIRGYKRYEKVRARFYVTQKKMVKTSQPTTTLFTQLANVPHVLTGLTRNEIKKFDRDFVEQIEKVLPSLEQIVVSPHKFITEFTEIVQVEKARKITPRAVKYMAQNSKDISEVLEDGRVIPKKVLNVFVDDDLIIYENRFIMTLVQRLQIFIELRYKYIQSHGDTKNSDQITFKKDVQLQDLKFEFEGKIKMSIPSEDEGNRESNLDLLDRLTSLRKRTMFLVNSRFMSDMAKATPVTNPIRQTNIIRLNYAYQDAYRLWLFINRYDELGVTYKTTQAKVTFDEDYIERLNQLTMSAFLAIQTEHGNIMHANIVQKLIKPVVKPGMLDFDLSDERFLEHGLPVKVTLRAETPEQREARLKKAEAKEKAQIKKELAKALAKHKAQLQKAKAKEKKAQQKKAEKEKAKQKEIEAKARQAEKNLERERKRREKEAIIAERKAYQNRLQEEARRLKLARLEVARVASEERKQDGSR